MHVFLQLFYAEGLKMIIDKKEIFVIIPARSGSKGIPDKNIKDIWGKSLLTRALEAANQIVNKQNVCLSSDSIKYFEHIKPNFSPIFLKRSKELSQDNSLAIDVWKDAINFLFTKNKRFNYSIFLEPTSPLRNVDWINQKISDFIKSDDDLWMSIKETDSKYRIEKQFKIEKNGAIKKLYKDDEIFSLRQNSSPTYHKDGVFYIAKNDYILKTNKLFGGKIKGIINHEKSVNIDTFEDLDYATYLLKNN